MGMNEFVIPDEIEKEISCNHNEHSHKHKKKLFSYQDIENFYSRVITNLGVSQAAISNQEIDFPENAPEAERRVKKLVPDWECLDKHRFSLFETCIVYMTCYILCPTANKRRVTKQTTPSLTLQYSDSAAQEAPCKHFLDLIDDLLSEINDEETSDFFGFRVTEGCGCRRRKVWSTRLPH